MLSIFRKKQSAANDFSGLRTDMHSHLLPGIDDGATDPDNSIELIRGLLDLGFEKFITTPHIFWDLYKNDINTIANARYVLQEKLEKEKLSIKIHAAAEYYLDDHFDELNDKKVSLLTLKDKMVLVEFSFLTAPANFKDMLFRMQINGYQPVLAHPERYSYLAGNKKIFDELKSAGCLFQLNLLSLTGYYGPATNSLAQYLLKKDFIDLLGTDLHHLRHLEALRRSTTLMPVINNLLQSGRLLNPSL